MYVQFWVNSRVENHTLLYLAQGYYGIHIPVSTKSYVAYHTVLSAFPLATAAKHGIKFPKRKLFGVPMPCAAVRWLFILHLHCPYFKG